MAQRRADELAERRYWTEREVLGAVFLDPESLQIARKWVSAADFSHPGWRATFAAQCVIEDRGREVTLPSTVDELERARELHLIPDGIAGLGKLVDEVATAALIGEYARTLRRLSLASEARLIHGEAIENPLDDRGMGRLAAITREIDALDLGSMPVARAPLLTVEEFASDVPPEPIVEDLIFEHSLHNMPGGSKVGKSWFAHQLCMCIAAGVPFLGLRTQQVPVLLVSLEMSAGLIRQRMETIHQDVGIPLPRIGETMHVIATTRDLVADMNLLEEKGRDELRQRVEETGAGLVVLDTLYRFIPGVDPSDNGMMGQVFGNLLSLSHESAAIWSIDHVRKGEQGGPVSHSALGAVTKGGASNVIASLKRSNAGGGSAWELDVESHYGSWESPIAYTRPQRPNGSLGGGCVRCSASEARGLSEGALRDLFVGRGDRDDLGRPCFDSQRKLIDALEATGLVGEGSRSAGQDLAKAIERDYCAEGDSLTTPWKEKAPIWTYPGQRGARRYVWRMVVE